MKKYRYVLIPLAAVALLLLLPGASFFYESSAGQSCTRCHEIQKEYDSWHSSTHRSVGCKSCHGETLTTDVSFHLNNLNRLISHLRGDVPDVIHIRNIDVQNMMVRCQSCHQQEFAQWQTGPHSATYSRIFLDKEHNHKVVPMADCMRCHGAHFGGGIRDLVTPVSTKGPWQLKDPSLANRPTIPCMACHMVHTEGQPLRKPNVQAAVAGPKQELFRPSLGFYDRREQMQVSMRSLPLPEIYDGARIVKISRDPRQGLCYQCHAPEAGGEIGSSDDRTPMGVHEGISCLACHQQHGEKTRASCANCHPKMSNCGIDVETMDTTFKSAKSAHNIHFVKCADCHTKGVPKRKLVAESQASSVSGGR